MSASIFSTARDSLGNALAEATVTVYDAGTTDLRNIFSDAELLVAKLNPFTADLNGNYRFFTAGGLIKIKVTKGGFEDFEEDNLAAADVETPAFRAIQTSAQSITPDDTQVDLSFDSIPFQSNFALPVSPFTAVVAPETGLYLITAGVGLVADVAPYTLRLQAQVDGATVASSVAFKETTDIIGPALTVAVAINLASGQSVKVRARQNSAGGAEDTAPTITFFSMALLRGPQ